MVFEHAKGVNGYPGFQDAPQTMAHGPKLNGKMEKFVYSIQNKRLCEKFLDKLQGRMLL